MKHRDFIKNASFATAGITFLNFPVFGKNAPANKVQLAVMGVNSRGQYLAEMFAGLPNVEIAYLCDVEEKAIANGLKPFANASKKPTVIKDVRELVKKKDFDGLLIAAPDHWHAPASILGVTNGKHVYVEKPCSHNAYEGELLIRAMKKYPKQLIQMGNQRRSMPNLINAAKQINGLLAEQGKILFNNNCSSCHGTYGKEGQYPNLLIPQSIIQTDSLLQASNYNYPEFIDWFNKSWFSSGEHPAKLVPFKGYLAPPLDGVWITAPYFHNGSVPSLEAVLNSGMRPKYWYRDFNKPQYNYDNPGWIYSAFDKADSRLIYNTTLPGYGNYGHYFGDKLTAEERKAVIEYLKTL